MKKNLIGLIIIGSMLVGLSQETEIHLAGIFPINGVEGWQGGQVPTFLHTMGLGDGDKFWDKFWDKFAAEYQRKPEMVLTECR